MGVRVKQPKLPGGASNENNKETMGGSSCTASADSRGFGARRSAVQLDQSRNCGRSSKLCAQFPLAESAEENNDVGNSRDCTRVVAAGVPSGDPREEAIPLLAVSGGIGAFRAGRPGDAERSGH